MTTNSQLSTTEYKKKKMNKKLSKQLEQNHRNGDHMEIMAGMGREGEKVQRISSINCR